jgi:hypothetical protein
LTFPFSLFVRTVCSAALAQFYSRAVPIPENREKHLLERAVGGISHIGFGEFRQGLAGTSGAAMRRRSEIPYRGWRVTMVGKIAGALLGKKLAGSNEGAKGALIGAGAAALARRSVPALAAVAAAGWGIKKLRERRARKPPTYPSEASPASPS